MSILLVNSFNEEANGFVVADVLVLIFSVALSVEPGVERAN
jgi:hypothetical protein